MKAITACRRRCCLTAVSALAAPVTYNIDPDHTYPSFEADHMGGLSKLRGKFNSTTGTIVLDKEAKTGTVDITIDTNSLDFGHDKLNDHAKKGTKMFDVAQVPDGDLQGQDLQVRGRQAPEEVQGELTLHGVTKPVTLKINQFLCKQHPMRRRKSAAPMPRAPSTATTSASTYGENFGFKHEVKLRDPGRGARRRLIGHSHKLDAGAGSSRARIC